MNDVSLVRPLAVPAALSGEFRGLLFGIPFLLPVPGMVIDAAVAVSSGPTIQ